MAGKICKRRPMHGLALAAAAGLMLAGGTALAQVAGMSSGPPALGVPGNVAPGGTGIPFGATELGTRGLSPPPLGTGALGTAGLGAPGMATPSIPGSPSSLGNGLSPGVMAPSYPALSPGIPPAPGATN